MNNDDELPTLKQVQKSVAKSIRSVGGMHNNRMEVTDPDKARGIIEYIAMGGKLGDAAKKFDVDLKTIYRVHQDHREVIGLFREYNAGEAFLLKQRTQAMMHKKMDMMENDEEQIKKTNLRDFAQAASMMNEGYQNAIGEGAKAAVTINVGPTFEDVQRHLEEIRAKVRLAKNVTETPIDLC